MLLFSNLKWSHWTHNTNFFHCAQLLSQMENHDFMCGLWAQTGDLLSINSVSLTSSSRKPGKTFFIQQHSFCKLLFSEVKQVRQHYLLISCFKAQTVVHGPNPVCHLFCENSRIECEKYYMAYKAKVFTIWSYPEKFTDPSSKVTQLNNNKNVGRFFVIIKLDYKWKVGNLLIQFLS